MSGANVVGRDGIEPPTLRFSRALVVRGRPRWYAGVVASLISRVEVDSVIPGDPAPSGVVRIG